MENKKRVVLDTSIIISACLSGGINRKIFEKFKQSHFILILNAHLMKEYDEKLNDLSKKLLLNSLLISDNLNIIRSKALFCRLPVPATLPAIINDHDDMHLLEIAFIADVDYIVLSDKKTFNKLSDIFLNKKTKIITPSEFIEILKND